MKGITDPVAAVRGSQVVAAGGAGRRHRRTDRAARARASTEDSADRCRQHQSRSRCLAQTATFGKDVGRRYLAGHPMAGKEQSGVEVADPDLFQGAVWFVTPSPGQKIFAGRSGEFLEWVEELGAGVASMEADAHDQLCAWISHLPQMISTALAATLVDEYGEDAPLLETGGRALREMTRISASPYSMWRDVALTNKKNIAACPVEAGTASGAYSREPGYAGTGTGVRAGASSQESRGQTTEDAEDTEEVGSDRSVTLILIFV